jgi:hypothetical protein
MLAKLLSPQYLQQAAAATVDMDATRVEKHCSGGEALLLVEQCRQIVPEVNPAASQSFYSTLSLQRKKHCACAGGTSIHAAGQHVILLHLNTCNTPTLQRMLLASPLGTIQSEKLKKQGSNCSALQRMPAPSPSLIVIGVVHRAGSVQLELVVTL